MVAHDAQSLLFTLKQAVVPAGSNGGKFTCPYCSLHNLTETELWYHCPAYHINWPNEVFVTNECPICRDKVHGPLQVRLTLLTNNAFEFLQICRSMNRFISMTTMVRTMMYILSITTRISPSSTISLL